MAKTSLFLVCAFAIFPSFAAIDRLSCVQQRTCKLCSNGRYSDYRCIGNSDCYSSENCIEGFCCPKQGGGAATLQCADGSVATTSCTSDFQCNTATQTCINNQCCPKTTSVHSGSCPSSRPTSNVFNQCTSDTQCRLTEKCCDTVFGVRCTLAVAGGGSNADHSGACPSNPSAALVFNQCSSDAQCRVDEKCCSTLYGRRCTAATGGTVSGECGANTERVACRDDCPPYCAFPMRQPCPNAVCVPGCHCLTGYIRQTSSLTSPCLLQSQCSVSPGACRAANEVESQCYEPCQPYCGNTNRPSCRTGVCQRGCACRAGYIRQTSNPTSTCVPASCTTGGGGTSCTGVNEQLVTCQEPCQRHCADRLRRSCLSVCQPGCECRAGYIRQSISISSACVAEATCTGVGCTNANEQQTSCYEPCPSYCGNLNRPSCRLGVCQTGCQCTPGYVRQNQLATSPCVLSSACGGSGTNQCLEGNQIQVSCYEPCQPYCGSPNRPSCRTGVCQVGCGCPSGFLRQSAQSQSPCVLISQCGTSGGTGTLHSGIAVFGTQGSSITGTVRLAVEGNYVRIIGAINGLPDGTYQLTVNQNGDRSGNCQNTGSAMYTVGAFTSQRSIVTIDARITISAGSTTNIQSLLGRSLLLRQSFSSVQPLACAVIGGSYSAIL